MNDAWYVLDKDAAGLDFIDDPCSVFPDPSFIVESAALSGDTEWLAWDATRDDVHSAAPRAAIEGCEIVPDSRSIHDLRVHPRHPYGRETSFLFDNTHSAVSGDDEGESEFDCSNPCTDGESID